MELTRGAMTVSCAGLPWRPAERSWAENLTLVFLPSGATERNPVEKVWQHHLRANWLSTRGFDAYDHLVETVCQASYNLNRPSL